MLLKEERLEGIDTRLASVVRLAATKSGVDLMVLEGLRTKERQKQLYEQGASKTLDSYHLTGHAVDVAPVIDGKPSWHWPQYYKVAEVMKQCAAELDVDIQWGGDWRKFKDGPHWQVPR